MNKHFLRGGESYSAPEVEMLDIKIEGGFALSDLDIDPADEDNFGEF